MTASCFLRSLRSFRRSVLVEATYGGRGGSFGRFCDGEVGTRSEFPFRGGGEDASGRDEGCDSRVCLCSTGVEAPLD